MRKWHTYGSSPLPAAVQGLSQSKRTGNRHRGGGTATAADLRQDEIAQAHDIGRGLVTLVRLPGAVEQDDDAVTGELGGGFSGHDYLPSLVWGVAPAEVNCFFSSFSRSIVF